MKYFIYCLIGLVTFVSCREAEENQKSAIKKREKALTDSTGIIHGNSTSKYIGKPGVMIVVSENTVYTGEVQEALDSFFGAFIRPYYPPQQKFELRHVSHERFNKGLQRSRNLIFLELSDAIEENAPEVVIKKDYYAKTQLAAYFRAKTMDDLVAVILKESPRIVELFDTQEWKREYYRHKRANNKVLKAKLKDQFGITLELPKKGKYETNRKNFAKIMLPDRSRQMDLQTRSNAESSKTNFIQSGIMIWQIPFKDSSQLNPAYLMRARDTILKYNALHEFPGVYMGTQDHPAVLPVHTRIKIGDVEGYEFKGLYKFTGRLEPSGGKFWSFHFLHPKRNKIIAISGYLDAPPTMNPTLDLKRIQAIIYSLKIED